MEKHNFCHSDIHYINCAKRCRLEIISRSAISLGRKILYSEIYRRRPRAKHILIEHNLRLVAHVIKKYQNLEEDPEDLISIGTIGLIKAVVTFNPDKGNRLAAYASRCVENEILMYLRSRKKNGKEISLYEPIGTDREGNEIRLYDIMELYVYLFGQNSSQGKYPDALRKSGKRAFLPGKARFKNAVWPL